MRQRVSTQTQHCVRKQQLQDLMDVGYIKNPTFRASGFVTAMGLLQLLTAFALLGFFFGGALLFCIVVLTVLVLVLLHRSEPIFSKQGMGLEQAINCLYALRRSALDYSLTLSVAQSQKYQQSRKYLQNLVVPTSPMPEKVVATMALNSNKHVHTTRKESTPVAKVKTIKLLAMENTANLLKKKLRAHSNIKQVLRSRRLLPLKLKRLHRGLVQQNKNEMEEMRSVPLTTLKWKAINGQHTKEHTKLRLKIAMKKEVLAPPPKVKPVANNKVVEVVPPTTTVVVEPSTPHSAPLSVYPKLKPLIEIAFGEPAVERDLVFTRKVLLYSGSKNDLVMDLEEDAEDGTNLEFEAEPVDLFLSLAALSPLTPTTVLQAPKVLPTNDIAEANFLLDIDLEPISKPAKVIGSAGLLPQKHVDNTDLRMMLEELDVMQSELCAAMACCTLVSTGD